MNSKVKAPGLALAITLFLMLSFKTGSLWTDEAFSAFIACHKTLSALWATLLAGDSSDLQMWLYYTYLHFWVELFGRSEIALRAANIPFVLLFSATVVWLRYRLFSTNWVWLALLSPYVWTYAGDARPYMIIVALSTVFVACLVALVTDPRFASSRFLPPIALSVLLIGMNFHMLMILLIPPSLVLVLVYHLASGSSLNLRSWRRPALWFGPLFIAHLVFLAWTFHRGTNYDYAKPDLLSMASVFFHFAGLEGFAPNRHYEIPFTPYIPGMALSAVGLLVCSVAIIAPAVRHRDARTISLLAALVTGVADALVLSFVFKEQIEARHLACLFVVALFLLFSALEAISARGRSTGWIAGAVAGLCLIWLVSDWRLTYLPEYDREDFRAATAQVIALANQNPGARIAVVADPAAVGYYGLSVQGASPCFPLGASCQTALAAVAWPPLKVGDYAVFWRHGMITQWLRPTGNASERILLISRSRHPMYSQSYWWKALSKTRVSGPTRVHGFFVYEVGSGQY